MAYPSVGGHIPTYAKYYPCKNLSLCQEKWLISIIGVGILEMLIYLTGRVLLYFVMEWSMTTPLMILTFSHSPRLQVSQSQIGEVEALVIYVKLNKILYLTI